jgi:DNA-binding transcriptional ArsR family regulator
MSYNTQEYFKPKKDKKDDFVEKNFLLVSLEEKKAKKIAEVINNDTARKILDRLAQKDATESEISKELDIPISTVHYNLKQLQDAQLVTVEEFHYSKKGKEVNHYSLANKYIIIAPRNENPKFLEALKKVLPITVITAIVGGLMTAYNFISAPDKIVNEAAPRLMAAAPEAAEGGALAMKASDAAINSVPEISRPFFQSNTVAFFLIGALAVIIIYFFYEWTKKN